MDAMCDRSPNSRKMFIVMRGATVEAVARRPRASHVIEPASATRYDADQDVPD